MSTIEVEGLSIQRGVAALREIDLHVAEGEAVAVIGEDQTVLTLLVRCCGGLEQPDHGRVRVAGVNVVAADRRALLDLRRTVGYVSIHGGLLANMTLRDNVELPLRYYGEAAPSAIADHASRLLDDAGMAGHADQLASTLSAEVQKCGAYLRAVACGPRVLLVEDPSALLAPQGRAFVRQLHRQLREQGVTVLVTDDDDVFATEITDRQLHVADGRIVAATPEGAR